MRETLYSQWDERMRVGAKNKHEAFQLYKFVTEIERLDKAHKRAKRELRKQQKAIEHRNIGLKAYRDWIDNVYEQLIKTQRNYKHMARACDEYVEENQELKEGNQELFEENRELKEENRELKEENERLKKELEYQELHNSKLTYANVKQVETIKQRNAEVEALKQKIHACGRK